jgi:DNA-binding XRE family transcriptional regulator
MVYFIGNNDIVKIGYSKDINSLKNRLISIQTGNHTKVEILLLLDGDFDYEKTLHNKFKSYRASGEWFSKSGEINSFIETNKINSLFVSDKKNDDKLTLKTLRKLQGISLQSLAENLHITKQSAFKIEKRYEEEAATVKKIRAYANALGYDVHISFFKMK